MKKDKLKWMIFAAMFAALTAAVAWFKIPLPFTPVPITLQTLLVLLSGAVLGAYYGALAMIIYLLLGAIGLPVFAGGSSGIGVLLGPTGGYLFSYPIAAFVIGKMTKSKKISVIIKYLSFVVILIMVSIVAFDAIFNIGIMKLKAGSMVSALSSQQRLFLIAISILVLAVLAALAKYSKSFKKLDFETVLAMFAGTAIIYAMGALQGKLVTGLAWNAIFVGWVLPFILGDTLKIILAAWIAKNTDMKRFMK